MRKYVIQEIVGVCMAIVFAIFLAIQILFQKNPSFSLLVIFCFFGVVASMAIAFRALVILTANGHAMTRFSELLKMN